MKKVIPHKILPATFFFLVAILQFIYLIFLFRIAFLVGWPWWIALLVIIQTLLILLFNLLIGFVYLLREEFKVQAKGFLERYFPLLVVLAFLFFNFWNGLSKVFGEKLFILGSVISILGLTLAITSLFYLWRSFSMMIEVRTLVTKGPYRLIRHPLYLGETLGLLGMTLVRFHWSKLIIFGLLLGLVVFRALREEKKLPETIPAYRRYQKKTGFLWPKIG